MRDTCERIMVGNHVPPPLAQPRPSDNTSDHVMRQVRRWVLADHVGPARPVHVEVAREIAAWWQAPDNDFAVFASTGTIGDDLADEVKAELSSPLSQAWDDDDRERNLSALRALLAYLQECKVIVWSVGQNIAGYLPESDIFRTLDYADAVDEYRRMLTEDAPEGVARTDECECEEDGGELCELCATDALVAGYLRDDVPDGSDVRYGRAAAEEQGLVIHAESWAGSMSYWLRRDEMTYGEFLLAREL